MSYLSRNKSRKSGVQRSMIEQLESRQLLTAASITIDPIGSGTPGLVHVIGTEVSDMISAGTDPNNSNNYYFLVITPGQGTVLQSYLKTSVTGVRVTADPISSSPNPAGDADQINLGGTPFPGSVGIQGGVGADTIIGSDGGDAIFTGTGTGSIIYGVGGDDTISGEGANQTLRGGTGNDLVYAGSGNNVLAGGAGDDRLVGSTAPGAGNDTLRGGLGNNTLNAGNGDDELIGGLGSNLLDAGGLPGHDTLMGGGGNNSIIGGTGASYMSGNWEGFLSYQGQNLGLTSGNDTINAGSTNDQIASSAGTDSITGSNGSTYFAVNNTSATLVGTPGAGVAENDVLTGAPVQTTTINLTINVVQSNGSTLAVQIPSGAGDSPNGTSVASATDANGTVVFSSSSARTFTLADFFRHWGVFFTRNGVGQFSTRGGGHTLTMTVNSVDNAQFQNYVPQTGDNVVITYHI